MLGDEPELFFLSSALQLSGFQAELPNPSLPLTIFAPNNAAFLGLLSELSASLPPALFVGPEHVLAPLHSRCRALLRAPMS